MKEMKGQSALEYLVTYGWAILAVIIIAALLWVLGVLPFGSSTTPSVKELVLNSTPEFTECVDTPNLNNEFVCSQENGYRLLVNCFKLDDGVYCASSPLVQVGG